MVNRGDNGLLLLAVFGFNKGFGNGAAVGVFVYGFNVPRQAVDGIKRGLQLFCQFFRGFKACFGQVKLKLTDLNNRGARLCF